MRRILLHLLLISVLGIVIYSNTLTSPFIWDDNGLIVENSNIRNLSNFTDLSGTRYLTFLSVAVNYRINGYNVAGYHIFNIAVHILNALLLYSLVVIIFKTPFLREGPMSKHSHTLALFAGLLFVSHPVYTQAVTNINQRSVLLATFFYLLSIISFIKSKILLMCHRSEVKGKESDNERSSVSHRPIAHCLSPIAYYLISLLSAVLAMKCKEIAFTLPVIILLCDRYFFAGQWGLSKSVLYLIPILLTLLIIPLSKPQADVFNKPGTSGFSIKSGNIFAGLDAKTLSTIARKDYLLTEFRVIPTYIRLFFLPLNLNLDYDYPVYSSFLEPNVFLSFLFLLLIAGLAVSLYYLSRFTSYDLRLISLGILWFFINLSVESFVTVLDFVIFEYRLYLPSIGILFSAGAIVFCGMGKLRNEFPHAEKFIGSAFILITISFAATTYTRNSVWKDAVSLWKDTVIKSPNKSHPNYELGSAYGEIGYTKDAFYYMKRAKQIDGLFFKRGTSLAESYMKQGLIVEAITEYKRILKTDPKQPDILNNLGIAYHRKGLFDEAIKTYIEAIRLRPGNAVAHCNLGFAYYEAGLSNKAVDEFIEAVRLDPRDPEPHSKLALAYMKMGLIDKALSESEYALGIDPQNPLARKIFEEAKVRRK